MRKSAQYHEMWKSAQYHEMWKSAQYHEMRKSAQYHIGRANSNSISLTSKPQQSVSSVGNLQAEDSPLMKQTVAALR